MLNLGPLIGRIERPAVLPALMERAVGAVEVAADVFALLGVIAGKLPVLPDSRERLELKLGCLAIRRIAGLAFRAVHCWPFDVPAADRRNPLGKFLIRPHQD